MDELIGGSGAYMNQAADIGYAQQKMARMPTLRERLDMAVKQAETGNPNRGRRKTRKTGGRFRIRTIGGCSRRSSGVREK